MTAITLAYMIFNEPREVMFDEIKPSEDIIYRLEIDMVDYLNAPRRNPNGTGWYSLFKCITLEDIKALDIEKNDKLIFNIPETAFFNAVCRLNKKQKSEDFIQEKKVLLEFKRVSIKKIEIITFSPI